MPKHQDATSPKFLPPQKASDYIGLGRTRLMALLRLGKIKGKRDNGRAYLSVKSLDDYMAALPDA